MRWLSAVLCLVLTVAYVDGHYRRQDRAVDESSLEYVQLRSIEPAQLKHHRLQKSNIESGQPRHYQLQKSNIESAQPRHYQLQKSNIESAQPRHYQLQKSNTEPARLRNHQLQKSNTEFQKSNSGLREGRIYPACTVLTSILLSIPSVGAALSAKVLSLIYAPGLIITGLIAELGDRGPFNKLLEDFIACQFPSTVGSSSDETSPSAFARISGPINGTLMFLQSNVFPGDEDPDKFHNNFEGLSTGVHANDKMISIIGNLEDLNPGRYSVAIHESGDVSENCAHVGPKYLGLEDAILDVDSKSTANLVLHKRGVTVQGSDSVIGRSVVVTSQGNGLTACAVIVRMR